MLVGVGAAFDFHAGLVSQAPRWMQSLGPGVGVPAPPGAGAPVAALPALQPALRGRVPAPVAGASPHRADELRRRESSDAAASGCRSRWPSPTTACARSASRTTPSAWPRCASGGCRSRSRAPTRSCSASTSPGPSAPPTPRRPTRSSSRSARRRSRTSRSTCATSARCSTTCCPCCARATCSCCARPSRRARPSSSRATSRSTSTSRSARDVFVAHVPERIAAGRFFEEIGSLPCIVGGVGEALGRGRGRAVRAARRADRADDARSRPSWRRSGPTSCATRCSRSPTA